MSAIFQTDKKIRLGVWGLGRGSSLIRTADKLNIEIVAEDNVATFVEVDDSGDVGDRQAEEIEEIAILTVFIGVGRIVHRGFAVTQKDGDAAFYGFFQLIAAVLVNFCFK